MYWKQTMHHFWRANTPNRKCDPHSDMIERITVCSASKTKLSDQWEYHAELDRKWCMKWSIHPKDTFWGPKSKSRRNVDDLGKDGAVGSKIIQDVETAVRQE
jgi:hypothetical protein